MVKRVGTDTTDLFQWSPMDRCVKLKLETLSGVTYQLSLSGLTSEQEKLLERKNTADWKFAAARISDLFQEFKSAETPNDLTAFEELTINKNGAHVPAKGKATKNSYSHLKNSEKHYQSIINRLLLGKTHSKRIPQYVDYVPNQSLSNFNSFFNPLKAGENLNLLQSRVALRECELSQAQDNLHKANGTIADLSQKVKVLDKENVLLKAKSAEIIKKSSNANNERNAIESQLNGSQAALSQLQSDAARQSQEIQNIQQQATLSPPMSAEDTNGFKICNGSQIYLIQKLATQSRNCISKRKIS